MIYNSATLLSLGPEAPARKEGRALLLLAAVTLATLVALLIVTVQVRSFDGARINLAGRQRMLTQMMAKQALLVIDGRAELTELTATLVLFEGNLDALIDGGSMLGDGRAGQTRLPACRPGPTRDLLLDTRRAWAPIHERWSRPPRQPEEADLVFLVSHNEALLEAMDRAVRSMQADSERTNLRFAWALAIGTLLMITVLVVLALRQTREVRRAREMIAHLEQLLPICCVCKSVRRTEGDPTDPENWVEIERFVRDTAHVRVSHGLCPSCFEKTVEGY